MEGEIIQYKSVTFNGTELASGMYIYRLTAEGTDKTNGALFTQTLKMLLVK